MKIRITLASICSLFILGCSSQLEPQKLTDIQTADGGHLVAKKFISMDGFNCKTIKVVGSNIPQKRCTTKKIREKEKKEAEKFIREFESGGTTTD